MIPGKEFYGLLDFYKNEIRGLNTLVKDHKINFLNLKNLTK